MNMMNPGMQEELKKLQADPAAYLKNAGVNVPAEIMNDPKAIVMHLIQTGQVSSPALQRVMPMIRMMGGR